MRNLRKFTNWGSTPQQRLICVNAFQHLNDVLCCSLGTQTHISMQMGGQTQTQILQVPRITTYQTEADGQIMPVTEQIGPSSSLFMAFLFSASPCLFAQRVLFCSDPRFPAHIVRKADSLRAHTDAGDPERRVSTQKRNVANARLISWNNEGDATSLFSKEAWRCVRRERSWFTTTHRLPQGNQVPLDTCGIVVMIMINNNNHNHNIKTFKGNVLGLSNSQCVFCLCAFLGLV